MKTRLLFLATLVCLISCDNKQDKTYPSYRITLMETSGGIVEGEGGIYSDGESCTVLAIPDDGYTFVGWYESKWNEYGRRTSEQTTYSFLVTESKDLTAKFKEKNTLLVDVIARYGVHNQYERPYDDCQVSGGDCYNYGQLVTVKATIGAKSKFAGWYENGNKVSDELSYTFSVEGDKIIEAWFDKK